MENENERASLTEGVANSSSANTSLCRAKENETVSTGVADSGPRTQLLSEENETRARTREREKDKTGTQ
jgi:hypothetical protein